MYGPQRRWLGYLDVFCFLMHCPECESYIDEQNSDSLSIDDILSLSLVGFVCSSSRHNELQKQREIVIMQLPMKR
jgi:hypothetical protein